MNLVPVRVTEKIQKIHKKLFETAKSPKKSLINEYQEGGLKDVDVEAKIRSLQLGWVWRIFIHDYHP